MVASLDEPTEGVDTLFDDGDESGDALANSQGCRPHHGGPRAIFAAEIATPNDLDPMIERPLTDLAEFVGGGGKRIRPAYCYWGFVTGGGDPTGDGALAGAGVELLQAFALVHDDVMDGSPTRRGTPTVWARYIERHQAGGWNGEDRRFGEAADLGR